MGWGLGQSFWEGVPQACWGGGRGGLGPDHSRKVMGGHFGAQGAASTHRSPQKSHGFTETAKSGPGPGPQGQAPPIQRDAVAAASEQLHDNSGRTLKTTASHQHQQLLQSFNFLHSNPQIDSWEVAEMGRRKLLGWSEEGQQDSLRV